MRILIVEDSPWMHRPFRRPGVRSDRRRD